MRLTSIQPDCCAIASNLAEPESPIFMLKFLIIWSLLKGVKVIIHQSLALLAKDSIPITNTVDLLLLDFFPVELITVGDIECRLNYFRPTYCRRKSCRHNYL